MAASGWSFGNLASAGSICASAVEAAMRICSAFTCAAGSRGARVGARIAAASATVASLSFCPSGTKLSIVSTSPVTFIGPRMSASLAASATLGTMMSALYGLVSGEASRSSSVRIASVVGSLVCSGSESNSSRGRAIPASTKMPAKPPITASRRRASQASIGTAQGNPASRVSGPGRHTVIAAGRKIIVQPKAISIPAPAIRPSSATPAKSVGTNARNPAAVAAAATRICPPARYTVAPSAFAASG